MLGIVVGGAVVDVEVVVGAPVLEAGVEGGALDELEVTATDVLGGLVVVGAALVLVTADPLPATSVASDESSRVHPAPASTATAMTNDFTDIS
jgi:hypothetical protein